jgi:hypothetical protein
MNSKIASACVTTISAHNSFHATTVSSAFATTSAAAAASSALDVVAARAVVGKTSARSARDWPLWHYYTTLLVWSTVVVVVVVVIESTRGAFFHNAQDGLYNNPNSHRDHVQ